jgi:pilus assembly protein CpaB
MEKLIMNRRVVPIAIAVILAIAAGLVVFLFARSAENRVVEGDQPVNALVTTQSIAKGTTLQAAADAGSVQQTQVPLRLRPIGAVESVTPENGSMMAVSDLPASQMILDGAFAATMPGAVSTALQVPEGMVALSVPLSDPNKVGTFLRPGAEVGIFATVPPASGGTPADTGPTTRLLLDRVQVLAVGAVTQEQTGSATSDAWASPLITVAVTQDQAERLIQAMQNSAPYMVLLGEKTSLKENTGVSDQDLFSRG